MRSGDSLEEVFERGLKIRREVLGADYVDNSMASANDFMKEFEGKVALITGGGSGIGRATAVAFAREGAQVVIGNRNVERGEETVLMIHKAGGIASFQRTDVMRRRLSDGRRVVIDLRIDIDPSRQQHTDQRDSPLTCGRDQKLVPSLDGSGIQQELADVEEPIGD